jgi:hypothetical protein
LSKPTRRRTRRGLAAENHFCRNATCGARHVHFGSTGASKQPQWNANFYGRFSRLRVLPGLVARAARQLLQSTSVPEVANGMPRVSGTCWRELSYHGAKPPLSSVRMLREHERQLAAITGQLGVPADYVLGSCGSRWLLVRPCVRGPYCRAYPGACFPGAFSKSPSKASAKAGLRLKCWPPKRGPRSTRYPRVPWITMVPSAALLVRSWCLGHERAICRN